MHKFNRPLFMVILLLGLLLGHTALPVFAADGTRPSVNVSIDDIFWVVVGLGGIAYGLYKSARAGNAAQTDADLQARLAKEQHDREMMDRYERIHANASAQGKEAFGALVGVVQAFAGLTRWKGDDALVAWMKDIQTPGAPPDLTPLPATPGGEVTSNPGNL